MVRTRPLHIDLADADLEPHGFLVTDWRGEPVNAAPEEHDAIAWFGLEELSTLTLADVSYVALLPLLR